MNLVDALARLREELRLIDEAIEVFERLGASQEPRRHRPPQSKARQPANGPISSEIAQSLRLKFDEASVAYKSAAQEYHRLMNIVKDVEPMSPDGHRALMQALQVQEAALLQYESASKALWNFTVHGKLPVASGT